MPWLVCQGRLIQHHPFDLPIFLSQMQDEAVAYTVAPPAVLNMLLQNAELNYATGSDSMVWPMSMVVALVLGTRDYVRKNGFTDVVIALSGGIDSALVATLAVDALGADHVHTVAMPTRYSSAHSLADAADREGAPAGYGFPEVFAEDPQRDERRAGRDAA